MGSLIVSMLAEQKGNLKTNPNNLMPDVSVPLEQIKVPFSTDTVRSKPIQQRLTLKTQAQGTNSLSKPLEQLGYFLHASTFPNPVADHVIQQFLTVSAAAPNSLSNPKPEGPLEQILLKTKDPSGVVQQFQTNTAGVTLSRPVEQKPVINNTTAVTQFDFVDLIFPPCNSIKNPVDTNILWRIRDFGFPFDANSLIFTVEGVEVQNRPEFVITSLSTGLQLSYNPPANFQFDKQVVITLRVSDTAIPPNNFFLRCVWKTVPDVRAPIFRNISPACNSTNVSVTEPISFDVLDLGQGVNPETIQLFVEGVKVCEGLTLDPISVLDFVTVSGVSEPVSATGFHVNYEHSQSPFRFDSQVSIAIEAADLAPIPNKSLFVCYFGTEKSDSPFFINPLPEPCDTFVDNKTGLKFEVYGAEQGIDISTLEVRVDNELKTVFVRPRILRTV